MVTVNINDVDEYEMIRMTSGQNNYSYNTENQRFNIDKFVVYLNNLLATENVSESRIQLRIENTLAEGVRQILEHHLEETREQQARLRYLIMKFGGIPTNEKAQLCCKR
jgi:ferritin-like metal-binding protein YciE